MFAPQLDRRIALQRRALAAADANGERVESFATYASVWARKLEGAGREAFVASTTYAEASCRFQIRHRTDVLVTDRIVYSGVSFDIVGITEIGRKDGLELFCRAQIT